MARTKRVKMKEKERRKEGRKKGRKKGGWKVEETLMRRNVV